MYFVFYFGSDSQTLLFCSFVVVLTRMFLAVTRLPEKLLCIVTILCFTNI